MLINITNTINLNIKYEFIYKKYRKNFSGVNVLRKVNFSLEPGEVHALVGENGAGKSTFVKVLSGVYTPTDR
jgi:ABC-type sugar transport system ATPase subunit